MICVQVETRQIDVVEVGVNSGLEQHVRPLIECLPCDCWLPVCLSVESQHVKISV